MDIQGIIKDDRKKKILIIGLVILFIILGLVFFLTRSSNSGTQEDSQAQLLADFAKLSPRSGVTASTLSLMPKIALSADRTTVDPGQPVKISWKASNAESCVDINGDTLELTGSKSVLPKEPYTFDILCSGPEGTDIQSITIAVTGFPSIALSAYPDSVRVGEQTSISWSATNADRCVDSAGKAIRLSDSFSVSPKSPYTFSMSCTGPKGTTRKSVTVSIAKTLATGTSGGTTSGGTTGGTTSGGTTGGTTSGGTTGGTRNTGFDPWASISSFFGGSDSSTFFGGSDSSTAQEITLTAPTNVGYEATAKVVWTLKNVDALGCVFSNTVPNSWLKPLYPSSGSVVSSPLYETQTITISCTKGTANVQKSATITVAPKPIALDPNFTRPLKIIPEYTATGEQVTLSWEAKNATTCSLSKDGVFVRNITGKSGTVSIWETTAGTFSYTLECRNADGVIAKSGPKSVSVVKCSFTNGFGDTYAKKSSIKKGEVANGSLYGRNGAICIKKFGNDDGTPGSASSFASIWGFNNIFGNSNMPYYPPPSNSESHLCSWTTYYDTANARWTLDTMYHPYWEYLGSTSVPIGISCGRTWSRTYWNGSSFTVQGDGGGDQSCAMAPQKFVNSLTCLVK